MILNIAILVFPCRQSFSQVIEEIGYFNPSTIAFNWQELEIENYELRDAAGTSEVKIFRNSEGQPIIYGQDIFTSVCFDNQCRPLSITVYWNVTGRYLGFRLPEEEFLSRYDHEPFAPEDYDELHSLLADPYLPLGHVAFQELIEYSADTSQQIDGVSGATSKKILDYVVEGAAYTTYTMWNIIYGPMKEKIEANTEQELTSELLGEILLSPVAEDKIWGLKNIDQTKQLDNILAKSLMMLIANAEFYTAYSSIEVIRPIHLESENLQYQLLQNYDLVQYSLKREILKKLEDAPILGQSVISETREMLRDLNGEQLGYMIALYRKQGIKDEQTSRALSQLLKADNTFVADKAYEYLNEIEGLPDDIAGQPKKYSRHRN